MDENTKAEINNVINIIKTSCYQNFITYHNKVIKYIISEFSSEYSIEIITSIVLQFYKETDQNIVKIQQCLNHDNNNISTCLLYLVGMIQYELDEKYKK